MAGRLKEDVVSTEGGLGGVGGLSCSWELIHLLPTQLEQRGRLQKSVAKEVSGLALWCKIRGNGGPTWGLRLWALGQTGQVRIWSSQTSVQFSSWAGW